MPLQLGNWQLNVNGQPGTLNIASVDTAGNVTGTVTATGWALAPAVGFWNELAQQLTLWVTTPTAPSSVVLEDVCLLIPCVSQACPEQCFTRWLASMKALLV